MSITIDQLRSRLSAAEIIPLICTAVELSGDLSLLRPEYAAVLPKELIEIPINGGLSSSVIERALSEITDTLYEYLSSGNPPPVQSKDLSKIIQFLSNNAPEYEDLLLEQHSGSQFINSDKTPNIRPKKRRIGIIGAGPSGLAAAYALKLNGFDVVVYDNNSEIGGTWWVNTYPGCRLDTGRLSYSYSFYQNKYWTSYFTPQRELLNYYIDFVNNSGLRHNINLNTIVRHAKYNESTANWSLTLEDTRSSKTKIADFDLIISATGILNQPSRPNIAGIDDFEGEIIHSASWPDNMDLHGKNVSLLGTGASAFQIGPAICEDVKKLTIFQRNPPWVLPTPHYHKKLSNDLRWIHENIPQYHRWARTWEFWLFALGKYSLARVDEHWKMAGSLSAENERFRGYTANYLVNQYLDRPEFIDKVIPKYPITAKRMLRDNGVWATMLKDARTALVTEPIEKIESRGVRTLDGVSHPTDILVLATGFDASKFLGTIEIEGASKKILSEFWGESPFAYNTLMVPGFPNFFCLGGPNTGLVTTGNQIYMAECAINWILRALDFMDAKDIAELDVKAQVAKDFKSWIDAGSAKVVWGRADVGSWYKNARGEVVVSWPYSLDSYWEMTRKFKPEHFNWRSHAK